MTKLEETPAVEIKSEDVKNMAKVEVPAIEVPIEISKIEFLKQVKAIETTETSDVISPPEKVKGTQDEKIALIESYERVPDISNIDKEIACGISLFINDEASGFSGVLKARFSDFVVNEIDKEGNLVRLISVKPTHRPATIIEKEEIADKEELTQTQISEQLEGFVGAEVAEKIRAFIDEPTAAFSVETEVITDKAKRTEIHAFFKLNFPGVFKTEANDGAMIIKKSNGRVDYRENSKRKRNELEWGLNSYCHFTFLKENKETMDAVGLLAAAMKKNFGFAGTKDKRGVTVQRISIFKTTEAEVLKVNRSLRNMRVGNCSYHETELKLGDLKGNRFTIAIRDIDISQKSLIETRIETLKSTGFINYYGLQRFGSGAVSTHVIGIALLQGDWKAAVDLLLLPQSTDKEEIFAARTCWATDHDAKKALDLFPRYCTSERAILQFFVANPDSNNYLGALNAIPRSLRQIYVHAYQSLVWNNMVNIRVQKYGLNPIVGDIVLVGGVATLLTEVNLAEFKMDDVVLPLPGIDMIYPEALKQDYIDFMATASLDPLSMERKQKEYSLAGSYRPITGRVSEITHEFLAYNHEHDQLLLSDLDVLYKNKLDTKSKGEFHALKLEFSMISSHYATMAVRELMKGLMQ